RSLFHGLQLFVGEHHVLVFRELVALDHLVARDDLVVVLGADVLLLQPRLAFLVEEVERDPGPALIRRVQPDRDRDQAEGDDTRAYSARTHDAESTTGSLAADRNGPPGSASRHGGA